MCEKENKVSAALCGFEYKKNIADSRGGGGGGPSTHPPPCIRACPG